VIKYLIDTQILIWYQLNDRKLRADTLKLLKNRQNKIFVSQVTLFEIAIKQKLGKLPDLNISIDKLIETIEGDDFEILSIKDGHISSYDAIPLFDEHRDPFDRLILATALYENMPVISADEKFKLYDTVQS
jgi:PIN domain nuclease of toxin-antitoxin system